MNSKQTIHVGMLNSYNLITEKVLLEEILMSGIPFFAHVPDEEVSLNQLYHIIAYFEDKEMFEHCEELIDYMHENFNVDGSKKEEYCDCDMPIILNYAAKTKCAICNKLLTI